MDLEIVDDPQGHRFEARDGDDRAGFAEYHRYRDEIAFLHTEVDSRFEGRGVGGRLVRGALDAARQRGLSVLPFCSFVRAWIGKHPDYLELVPESQRGRFDL